MTLYSEIAEKIKKQIYLGGLKPGELLPNEIEFAETLSITRNTLRRALQILDNEGLIVRRKKAGTYIVDDVLSLLKSNLNIIVAANFGLQEGQNLFFQQLKDEKKSLEAAIAVHSLLANNTIVRMFSTSGKSIEIPEAEGYLIMDSMHSAPFVKVLAEKKLPHICFESHIPYPGVNTVMGNDEEAARLCTSRLIKDGYRKIAFVGGLLKSSEFNSGTRRRTEGYLKALAEAGADIDNALIFNDLRENDYESFNVNALLSSLMQRIDTVSAIVCATAKAAFMLKDLPRRYNKPVLCVDKRGHDLSPEEQKLMDHIPGCIKPREKIAEEGIKKLFEWMADPGYKPGCFKIDFERDFKDEGKIE